MPRRDPGEAPDENSLKTQPQNDVVSQTREYEVITALFGGGVTPAEADPITTIRASGIRGHLRFWWRACRAAKFGNLAEMKRTEDALWGTAAAHNTASGPSRVQISVIADTSRAQVLTATDPRNQAIPVGSPASPYGYVAWPLMDKPKGRLLRGITFTLTLTFPASDTKDVEAALWAWETFGGVGARTRRGFGALRPIVVKNQQPDLPQSNTVEAWLQEGLDKHVAEGVASDKVPHLNRDGDRSLRCTNRFNGPNAALECWRDLIKALHDFRQARSGNQGRGKSDWPEADAIRKITGKPTGGRSIIEKFPRAAFGLPIIFHFKDHSDPPGTTLQGADKEATRLASPLILRPLACAEGYVGLAIVLDGTQVTARSLELRGGTEKPKEVHADLTEPEARDITVLHGDTDVLEAFLDYLTED